MNSFVTEKQFWAEFIELYRQNECLWRIRSKDYINKLKKNEAYELLAEKLKEKDSDATIETVKKRINNMRSSVAVSLSWAVIAWRIFVSLFSMYGVTADRSSR